MSLQAKYLKNRTFSKNQTNRELSHHLTIFDHKTNSTKSYAFAKKHQVREDN